ALEQAAGKEAEDHGDESRNEAERLVSATVMRERLLAREEIQKPLVEVSGEIRVLVPVRGDSVQVLPVRIDAYGPVVESCGRQRVEQEGQPVDHQERAGRDGLDSRSTTGQEEQEEIAQPDLRQRILEREVGLAMM